MINSPMAAHRKPNSVDLQGGKLHLRDDTLLAAAEGLGLIMGHGHAMLPHVNGVIHNGAVDLGGAKQCHEIWARW